MSNLPKKLWTFARHNSSRSAGKHFLPRNSKRRVFENVHNARSRPSRVRPSCNPSRLVSIFSFTRREEFVAAWICRSRPLFRLCSISPSPRPFVFHLELGSTGALFAFALAPRFINSETASCFFDGGCRFSARRFSTSSPLYFQKRRLISSYERADERRAWHENETERKRRRYIEKQRKRESKEGERE